MKIYVVKNYEGIEDHVFDKLLQFVSYDKKNKIKRFINKKDRDRALLSDILIRYIICSNMKLTNKEINIRQNEFSKPYLNNYKNFHFNISHSGDCVVCAIDDTEIGIDVEEVKSIDYKELAESFYTEEEYNFIFFGNSKEQINKFYRLWTLKESYVKADGRGLLIPLKDFSINIYNDENIGVKTSKYLRQCYFKEFDIDAGYKMSVCSLSNNFPNEVVKIYQPELITKFMNLVAKE